MTSLRERRRGPDERGALDQLVQWMKSGNAMFPTGLNLTYNGNRSEAPSVAEYGERIYKQNGIVFACMQVRQAIFSEIRFRYANLDNGKIGTLFGDKTLRILERPGPNVTTGELAARMIQDADLAGQFYAIKRNNQIIRRDPQKMVIVLRGDPSKDEFAPVAGYNYYPAGVMPGGKFITYLPEETCHWSPNPDPCAEYRGMSWITPVLREIGADNAATDHKSEFFGNAATPQMVVKTPEGVMTQEQFDAFTRKMNEQHTGRGNRHKTLYLVPGSDVQVVGADFKQLDFSETQGRDETRIAAAAGVPAVIVGLKESMQGSSLNAGNYGQARRRLADGTMRPLYRSAAAALETLVPAPNSASQLWYDDSQVAFFREDRKDAADIQAVKAQTIRQLVDAGYEPKTVVAAVDAEDMTLLVHTNLFSVQLQAPGAGQPQSAA